VIATFAVALVLFLLFLRYLTAEKIHPRNSVSVRARHAVSLSSAPFSGSQLAFIRPANSLVRC
jgi:multisubunit Na+/H+ antiporter MnhB subunit